MKRAHLKKYSTLSLIAFILFTFFAFLSIHNLQPPHSVPESAPDNEFSSGRAMKHLQIIAQKPHPIGSVQSEMVRDYILRELTTMGLIPEVQEATVVSPWKKQRGFTIVPAATVHNVIARLRGTEHTKALLLVAHYDSVPTGPGASDDGAGVATILETLRALKTSLPLRNDVICLFTDGEEPGLFGAKAFVDDHPWAKDVGLVLNLEARGSSGPSFMFETSESNGWLIREFARAAPHPVASSLMYEIYKHMPNDTDMSIFKEAGFSGLNFSYVDGLNRYHTLLDSVEEIDERSLQHHGTYALALTRHFGNLTLTQTRADDAVYFNAFGSLVHYSRKWVLPLTGLAALLFVALVAVGLRRKRLTISGIGRGVLALLAGAISAAVAATLVWWIIGRLHRGYQWIPYGDPYNSSLYKTSFVLFTIAIISALHIWFRKKVSVPDLMVGALTWWLILLVLISLFLPAGSYLFLWPLLFTLIGVAFVFVSKAQETVSFKSFVVLSLCAVPGIILISSMCYMLFVTISINMPALVVLLLVLLLGLLVWYLDLVTNINKWLLPAASASVGLCLTLAGIATSGFDAHHRKANSIQYSLRADNGTAVWNCFDEAPDEWTTQFISAEAKKVNLVHNYPWISQPALQSPAPVAALVPPNLTVIDDNVSDGVRALRMRISSPRQAPMVLVRTESDTKVLGAVINGRRVVNDANTNLPPGDKWRMFYAAPPTEGFELILEVVPSEPLKLIVEDVSYELPIIPGSPIKARPDYMMPAPLFGASDSTLVSKSFTL